MLTNHWEKIWISLHWIKNHVTDPWNWNRAVCCNNMSAKRIRVIHQQKRKMEYALITNPTKCYLNEKRVSQNGQTPNIIKICSYCVLNGPVFELREILIHPGLTLGWSFLNTDAAHHSPSYSHFFFATEWYQWKNIFKQILLIEKYIKNTIFCFHYFSAEYGTTSPDLPVKASDGQSLSTTHPDTARTTATRRTTALLKIQQ